MGLARQAILLTLVVHAVVLGFLLVWPASEGTPPSETFAEVDFVEADALPDMPEQSFEETMRQALAEKIANVRANAEASASEEVRSSSDAAMAAEVEAELRQMEQAEFERLAAEEKEFETAGLADVESQQVGQSFDAWDAQYDGLVTVRYSLKGRSGRDLDVPGYLCEGGAMVEVAIEVDPAGRVVQAVLKGGDPEGCFGKAALRSARQARFSADAEAPKRQQGIMTYVFVAQ